jgi:hypothetical protein
MGPSGEEKGSDEEEADCTGLTCVPSVGVLCQINTREDDAADYAVAFLIAGKATRVWGIGM